MVVVVDEEVVALLERLTYGRNVNDGDAMAAVAVVGNTDGNNSGRTDPASPHDTLE